MERHGAQGSVSGSSWLRLRLVDLWDEWTVGSVCGSVFSGDAPAPVSVLILILLGGWGEGVEGDGTLNTIPPCTLLYTQPSSAMHSSLNY